MLRLPYISSQRSKVGCCLTGGYADLCRYSLLLWPTLRRCHHQLDHCPLRSYYHLAVGNRSSCDSDQTPQRVLNGVLFVLLLLL